SSFFSPQLPNMRACRKYWLIAVSSLNRILFRCSRTLVSPFIVLSPGSKRRIVARQAERDAAVRGAGDVGIERKMLLDRVRVAEGPRRLARFVQPRGARQPEHHVDRAHRPFHRVGTLEPVARLRFRIRYFSA